MPPEDGVATINYWWSTLMERGRAVEQAMENFSYFQEVANAYAMELIWTLALVLGCTCLYIWRALGVQEAARKHSRMVNSRPVFSSIPNSSVSTQPSIFLSAYKNRFAHKDMGREEERMNAVAYDVLHTCDLSPYPRRMLPRAVWKRHSTAEQDHLLSGHSGGNRNRLWSNDVLTSGTWGHSRMAGMDRGPCGPCPVPAQRSRRPENSEGKDSAVPNYHSQAFSRIASQLQQPRRQQQQQSKTLQHHQQSQQAAHREMEQIRRDLENASSKGPDVSPAYKMLPVPAPREDKVTVSQPVRLAGDLLLLNHAVKQMKQGGKLQADSLQKKDREQHGDCRAEAKDSVTSGDECVMQSCSSCTKTTLSSTCTSEPTDSTFSDHHLLDTPEVQQSGEPGQRPKGVCALTKELRTEHKVNVDQLNAQSANLRCTQSRRLRKEGTKETIDPLFCPDSSLTRHKAASSLLEKFAKCYFTDHRQGMHPDLDSEFSTDSMSEPLTSKPRKSCQPPKKNSGARVSRKRSKTTQKSDCVDKELSDVSTDTEAAHSDEKGSYDSAVLRAVRDEDEKKTPENTLDNASSIGETSSEQTCSDSRSKTSKNTTSRDAESPQNTIHEAGRRLAKLRKRLEDSIQLIQNQPGLDKGLIEKARSSKMKIRREELETMFMKEDIMELNSLAGDKDAQGTSDSDAKTQAELTGSSLSPTKTGAVGHKSTDQRLSGADSKEVCDGEPSSPVRKTKPAVPCHAAESPGAARETPENKMYRENQKEADFFSSSSPVKEKMAQVQDTDKSSYKKEKASLDHDNTTVGGEMAVAVSGHAHTETRAEKADGKAYDTDGKCLAESPRKWQSSSEDTKPESVRSLLSKGKAIDVGRVDAIVERQSKRREDLRQRKRMHIESVLAGKVGSKDSLAESSDQEVHSHSEAQEKHTDQTLEQPESNVSQKENRKDPVESSPGVTDGTPKTSAITESSERSEDKTSHDSDNSQREQTAFSDLNPYVSTRSLSHLKYEEPEIQVTRRNLSKDNTSSEKGQDFMKGNLSPPGPERESFARRRVRWRRQAEIFRLGSENQKTPPPVPPKVTRLTEVKDYDAVSHNLHQEAKTVEANPDNYKIVDSKERKLNELGEEIHEVTSPAKFSSVVWNPLKLPPSNRLIHSSFLNTIRDKNTALAAGEIGLARGPPDNVEICEEKSLTPSKAASVFDPKAQLEKEKEKQEAERALRASHREGMPSPQFRANIRLFEQAAEAPGDKVIDSKVKANVKIFEDVSHGEDVLTKSPERKRNERKSRSPSAPRPNLEPLLARDQ